MTRTCQIEFGRVYMTEMCFEKGKRWSLEKEKTISLLHSQATGADRSYQLAFGFSLLLPAKRNAKRFKIWKLKSCIYFINLLACSCYEPFFDDIVWEQTIWLQLWSSIRIGEMETARTTKWNKFMHPTAKSCLVLLKLY